MRQTAINCTERTEKPKTTRNVTAAVVAAGRWAPPAWCEDSATGAELNVKNKPIAKMGTHMVRITDRTGQTASEISRYSEFRVENVTPEGDAPYQGIPVAN